MVKPHLAHTIFIILICDGLNVSYVCHAGHDIFCCVYSEEVPEDGSLSGSEDEDVMASLSSNSGTLTLICVRFGVLGWCINPTI